MSTKSKSPSANAQQTPPTGYAKLLQDMSALKSRVDILEQQVKSILDNPSRSVDDEQKKFLKELFSNAHGN